MSFNDISFADNPDPRCPCALVLDVSGSMEGEPLAALQAGVSALVADLRSDALAARRVELAVVTFGADVQVAAEFATVDTFVVPALEASGPTPLGAAVTTALDLVKARKRVYKTNGVSYYRPWVMVITDGLPTDDVAAAKAAVAEAEADKAAAVFAVAIDGADPAALAEVFVRTPLRLNGLAFKELFMWLSASQRAVSASTPGDEVALPAPTGWAAV